MTAASFIFDVGNVLLRWAPQEIVKTALPAADPAERERIGRAIFGGQRWLDLDQGTVDERVLVGELARELELPLAEIERVMFVGRESLIPLPLGIALLHDVAGRGHRVHCLSNMSLGTFAHLQRKYDFWHRFSGIVLSAEVKLLKPDPAIFRHTLAALQLDPARTVFIDDHPPNVASARALGITAILFDGSPGCAAEVRALAGA